MRTAVKKIFWFFLIFCLENANPLWLITSPWSERFESGGETRLGKKEIHPPHSETSGNQRFRAGKFRPHHLNDPLGKRG